MDKRMRSMKSFQIAVAMMIFLTCMRQGLSGAEAGLPAAGNNKVAYYVFDSGGPDHFPLTSFTDAANIVILFEGTLWELADSAHYNSGWMRNVNYHSYAEIIRDVRILQARGVKVLMNLDDAASWSTATPFSTYDGKKPTPQEFAAFIKTCAIDSLHLDGISLDIEHGATGNATYIALLKEIGKYFGPRSSNSDSQIYTAAIYSGGAPGSVVGKSKDITSYMNFVMDMAYFNPNYAARFTQWADSIGASRTMIGVLNDKNDLTNATAAAVWQPARPPKAGIMVYAANNLKSYTDAVFNALVMGPMVAASPFPADNATGVNIDATLRWKADPTATSHIVYFGSGGVLEAKGSQTDTTFDPGPLEANTTYFWRVDEKNAIGTTIGPVWRFTTGTSTAVLAGREGVPETSSLAQNYPNPFNGTTMIGFSVGGRGAGRVRLTVCDMLGREVAVMVDERKDPGNYRVRFDGAQLASGVYLYRLQVGDVVQTRKLILLR
jgi:hypothetical protein